MIIKLQQTLSKSLKIEGIGLHSGELTKIKIIPAKDDHGIVFKRVDLKKNNKISADYKNVSCTKLCTTLENSYGVKVSTVEHLLAAFYISNIDNALVEINSEEIPILDGSARNFLNAINETGVTTLSKKKKYLKINKKFEFKDGERKISIEPNDKFLEVDFQLDYKNNIIGKQKNLVNFQKDNLEEIVSSRTFCLYEDIEKIKEIGLAKGGSLKNAIIVKDEKVLNEGGLRNKKEFVNHKILDLAGDFFLSGYRILGKVKCTQGGHQLTNKFLRNLFAQESIIEVEKKINQVISKNNILKSTVKLAVNA